MTPQGLPCDVYASEPELEQTMLSHPIAAVLAVVSATLSVPGSQVTATDVSAVRGNTTGAAAQESEFLFRVLNLRAAPAELNEVIALYKELIEAWAEAGESRGTMMRHSQGDQWDLMLLFPIGSRLDFYSETRVARRDQARGSSGRSGADLLEGIERRTSWREELFVSGPSEAEVHDRFEGAGFFHIEMFIALAGKRAELIDQRNRENQYLVDIGRDRNLVFVREGGAAWDCFTVGFYRDLQHYAEGGVAPEVAERAAVAAGFEPGQIGSFLRTLIASHHDTLAVLP